MIRPATLADVDAIYDIAMDEARMYHGLRPDPVKIRKGITQAISSAKHFAWVSVGVVRVEGALIGLTSHNLWAERQNCLVALWRSRIAGDGVRLLRAFKTWVQSRRAIRVAGFVSDSEHIDRRAFQLAERMGFRRCGGAYLLYN